MIVVLGELGGQDEYGVVEALKAGAITKPVVRFPSFSYFDAHHPTAIAFPSFHVLTRMCRAHKHFADCWSWAIRLRAGPLSVQAKLR